jgi:hypothetical protein
MSGGMFQGSNDADFAETSCFYTFEGVTNGNWYEVEVQDSAAYRYLRYIGPPSSHCNINEMEFYDEQGEKIEGSEEQQGENGGSERREHRDRRGDRRGRNHHHRAHRRDGQNRGGERNEGDK